MSAGPITAAEPVAATRPQAVTRRKRRRRKDSALGKLLSYTILTVGAIICVAPFAWMVVASIQPVGDMFSWPPQWIPQHPTLDNYRHFLNPPINSGTMVTPQPLRWFLNSLFVATCVTVGQMFFSSLAAYCFAKRRFPGRDAIFVIMLGALMIPGQVTLIPSYIVLRHVPLFGGNDIFGNGGHGWLDSYWGLIVPGVFSAFSAFLLRQYMKTIPDELLDAARIDGAGEFRIYWKIVMPLCRPALAALGIFTFSYVWNDFFWPLIIVTSSSLYTMPLGLALFVVQNRTAWDYLMAGSVIVTIPVIIMFLAFQRHFIRGISITGMK
jgi:multiple sugar transport system permease protein